MIDELKLSDPAVEVYILTSIITDAIFSSGAERAIEKVCSMIDPEHFAYPLHRRVFETMIEHGSGPVSLRHYFKGSEEERFVKEITTETQATVDWTELDSCCRILASLHKRNALIDLAYGLSTNASKPTRNMDLTIDDTIASLLHLQTGSNSRPRYELAMFYERGMAGFADNRVRTGWCDLDRVTRGGFSRSDMVIIAARTSVGKTTFAIQTLLKMMRGGEACRLLSLEMSEDQIGKRIGEIDRGINYDSGALQGKDQERHVELCSELGGAPDGPSMDWHHVESNISLVLAEIERAHREGKTIVAIDYLQQIGGSKARSQVEQIAEYLKEIHTLTQRYDLITVVMSQLNRQVEYRADGTPRLADLRGSGSIEEAAEKVLLLHRATSPTARDGEQGTFASATQNDTRATVYIAKNRTGPGGGSSFNLDFEEGRFRESALSLCAPTGA